MKNKLLQLISCIAAAAILLAACNPSSTKESAAAAESSPVKALASTSFLANIAQNVAGDRAKVESLLPMGVDPHVYEAKPSDVEKIANCNILILNGIEYEFFIEPLLENAGGERVIVEATAGLEVHQMAEHDHEDETHEHEGEEEHVNEGEDHEHEGEEDHAHEGEEEHEGHSHAAGDPHMWLDPIRVITYVENIRDGLIQADPSGEAIYKANAEAYIKELKELDAFVKEQVAGIPAERRLLVTNHEALGYFAERYGFEVVNSILMSFSSDATVSAQQAAQTIKSIKASGAPAIFLGEVENAKLAEQIAAETGVKVVDGLYLETLTEGPPAPTYIDMMKFTVTRIAEALK